MKQALVKKGRVYAEDVPAPLVSKGALLIKVVNSCISAGTELSGIQSSGKSLLDRVREEPGNVIKAAKLLASEGVSAVYERISRKNEGGMPMGYSIAGVVVAVGEGVKEFKTGDEVAAAGAGLANHAEYVDVPENLVVRMPRQLSFYDASSVALGSIAMHGTRRADLRLGEFGVVFGTGILGLLTIQILKLSGVRIIAVDIDDNRLTIAKETGADLIVNSAIDDPVMQIMNYTSGHGADAVVFTAATGSSTPLSQSFQICKKKGKVVLVGVSGMDIKRDDMYVKELDLVVSTSYGPGRYDKQYEEGGLDYPYAYVRWTEKRNMEEYLRLVQKGGVKLERLISATYPIEKVSEAYASLEDSVRKPLMVILDYGQPAEGDVSIHADHDRKVSIKTQGR